MRSSALRLPLLAAVLAVAGCASPGAFLPGPTGQSCTIHSDCGLGSYCQSGSCRKDCRYDFDCAAGRCDTTTGRCPGVDAGAPPDGSAAPPDATAALVDGATPADGALEPQDLAAAPDLAAPPGSRPYGDVCVSNTDCKSQLCSSNPFAKPDRECTGPCAGKCMLGDVCIDLGGMYGQQCAQSDIGNACTKGEDCRLGICAGVNQPSPFCTTACATAAECPAGYTCSLVQNTRVCVNVDATAACTSNAGCAYGTFCDLAHHRCLGSCASNAHCPLFHSCQVIGGVPLCAPNLSPGGGGIGAPCTADKDCRAGACLTDDTGKSFCLTACGITKAVGQWCPGGWGCNPVADGHGGYILGCLAAGSGSPGATCKDNTQCASGLCNGGRCTRYCNDAPCPSTMPTCTDEKSKADGYEIMLCEP